MPHVLIIDDESGIRFALRRWFERQDWHVHEAPDGRIALDLLLASDKGDCNAEASIQLIVCDLHLPGVSGETIVDTLNEQRPDLAERLILTTGASVHDAPKGSLLARHHHVLQKPFDLQTLKHAVNSVLGTA